MHSMRNQPLWKVATDLPNRSRLTDSRLVVASGQSSIVIIGELIFLLKQFLLVVKRVGWVNLPPLFKGRRYILTWHLCKLDVQELQTMPLNSLIDFQRHPFECSTVFLRS